MIYKNERDNGRVLTGEARGQAEGCPSSKGARYITVLCEIDDNAILAETMKNRTEEEMVKA